MRITITLPTQTLVVRDEQGRILLRYSVSTAKNGAGEQNGSYCTPRGRHIIRAKVGAGMTANTVFVRRRPTGEVWTPDLAAQHPQRDWILTRILWLSGKRVGFNRLGDVDTMRRYVYIHGSPDTVAMGSPGSIGCIRMRNTDIIELFDTVPVMTPVDIHDFHVTGGDWDVAGCHVMAVDDKAEVIGRGRLLPDGEIGGMAVAPTWRGRGVGRALLDALRDQARSAGLVRYRERAVVAASVKPPVV